MITSKQQILAIFDSMPDECSIAEAIDRLYLLQKIEQGIRDADEGKLMDHDDFFDELEREDAQIPSSLERTSTS